jgi:hypothetical protein
MYTDRNKYCTFIQSVLLLRKIVNIYEISKVDTDLCLAFSLRLSLETILAPTNYWQVTLSPVLQRV